MELEAGQKVVGEYIGEAGKKITYTGTVHSVAKDFAYIERDDGISGPSGFWRVQKRTAGDWGASGMVGSLLTIPKLSELDKSWLPNNLKIGDGVKGEYINHEGKKIIYTGIVQYVYEIRVDIKRDDGIRGPTSLGYFNNCWIVNKKDEGTWGAKGEEGTLTVIKEAKQGPTKKSSTAEGHCFFELKAGDRVRGEYFISTKQVFTGTVLSSVGYKAYIERDDNIKGGGFIPGYHNCWVVTKKGDGTWGANQDRGTLTVISTKPEPTKKSSNLIAEKEVPAPLRVWDRVIGSYEGKSYTGHVASIDYSKNEAYITRDVTLESVCVKKKPEGWGAYGVEGILTIMPKEETQENSDTQLQEYNKIRVGDRVKGTLEDFTGIVFSINNNNIANVKRDDGKTGTGANIIDYGFGWRSHVMNLEIISSELQVGDRVIGSYEGKSYTGSVDSIHHLKNEAYITRDDKWRLDKQGVKKKPDGTWGAYGAEGILTIMPKEDKQTTNLKVGDRVTGYFPFGGLSYTGVVNSIDPLKNRACITRDDKWKLDKWIVMKKPDGTWGSDGVSGTLEIFPREALFLTAIQENPCDSQLKKSESTIYTNLKVGHRVRGVFNGDSDNNYTGIVFSCSSEVANIKRDDGRTGSGDQITGYGKGWEVRKRLDGTWGSSGTSGNLEYYPLWLDEEGISMSSKDKQISKTLTGGFMNDLRSKFSMMLTKEPNKSFRKAGITDTNDMLTEEGKNIFLSWLLHSKHAEDFKKDVVDELLKDEKK